MEWCFGPPVKPEPDRGLKFIHPGRLNTSEAVRRFQVEAQTTASLNHPNIVTIFSVEQSDGNHFLSMELVEGRP